MRSLTPMTVFVEVARAGGFAAAARRLGMSATAVSRHVADLERRLGVALLRRTTRRVGLTEAGARYLPRAVAILEEIERMDAEIADADAAPGGRLRITAPPVVGHMLIAPLAVDFVEAYPGIELEVELSERVHDLVAEGFDAAIRSGELKDSTLIARRIVDIPYVVCGSPGYLARRGVPQTPEDLRRHDCVHWLGDASGGRWTLVRDGVSATVPVRPRLLINNLEAEREAALRGIGLAVLPLFRVREDIEAGRLSHVLPGHVFAHGILSVVRPPAPFEPARLRLFIDFIIQRLRERARQGAAV